MTQTCFTPEEADWLRARIRELATHAFDQALDQPNLRREDTFLYRADLDTLLSHRMPPTPA